MTITEAIHYISILESLLCIANFIFAAGDIKSEDIKSEKSADTALIVKGETPSAAAAHSSSEIGQKGIKREANSGSGPNRNQQDSKKMKT